MKPTLGALGLLALAWTVAHAAPVTITFEEPIPQPDFVTVQYCASPTQNVGVTFLDTGRIFTPALTPASGPHALYNNFGEEFDETRTIQIAFTIGQKDVSMKVGLDRPYGFDVTATLYAYSSDVPGTGFLTYSTTFLGSGPTAITQDISVNSQAGDIRSVRLVFTGASPGQFAIECIDDLTITTSGPPCVTDLTAPTVVITTPAADNASVFPQTRLAFTAEDAETGVSRVSVIFYDASDNIIQSFSPCGVAGSPSCGIPANTLHYDFNTVIPDGTRRIRVVAEDYAAHTGWADRLIDLKELGPNVNLFIRGLEITQGMQNWVPMPLYSRGVEIPSYPYNLAYEMPLVAGRATYVRLYAGVEGIGFDQEVSNVTATLRAFQNPECTLPVAGLHTLNPIKGQWLTIESGWEWDDLRDDLDHSFTFLLPEAWTIDRTIHLEAEIQSSAAIPECAGCVDGFNRLRLTNLTFHEMPPFGERIRTVRTTVNIDGTLHTPTLAQNTNSMDAIRKWYPLDEATVVNTPPFNWFYQDDTSVEERGPRALNAFQAAFSASQAADVSNFKGPVAYSALMPAAFPCAGLGDGTKDQGGFNFAGTVFDAAAHETGHSFGLNHCGPPPGHVAECANDYWCDKDWPWPHGLMGPYYGFDILTMDVIKPGDTEHDYHDFMSYGGYGNQWVSPRNWIRLYNAMNKKNLPYPVQSARNPWNAVAFPSHVILIRGSQTGEPPAWHLEPAYAFPPEGDIPAPGTVGEYRLELIDALANVLVTHRFSIADTHVDMVNREESYAANPSFAEMVAAPDLPAAIVLRVDATGNELARLTRSPAAPEVTLTSPTAAGFDLAGDMAFIRWTATDGDGGPLNALVQYRVNDGRTSDTQRWRTMAADVTSGELEFPRADVPGGAKAQVRLFVTDGVNTVPALSPEFSKENTTPTASILFPPFGGEFQFGGPIVLKGTGMDLEDGLMPGGALLWVSHLDGILGLGRTLQADNLTSGVHIIFLWAVDSSFVISLPAATVITVRRRLNTQPVADAGPDAAIFPGGSVWLRGDGSRDDDGNALAFLWAIESAPPGGEASAWFSNHEAPNPQFGAGVEGAYTLRLIVNDGEVGSLPDFTQVTVGDLGNVWRVK